QRHLIRTLKELNPDATPTTHFFNRRRVLSYCLTIGLMVVLISFRPLSREFAWYWPFAERGTHDVDTPINSIPAPLLTSQIEELRRLNDFLYSAQEIPNQDREDLFKKLFDFPEMVRYNLLGIRFVLFPSSVSPDQQAAMRSYFEGSMILADPRLVNYGVTPEGNYEFAMNLKKSVPYIRLSKKYLENQKRLGDFGNSILLPAELKEAVVVRQKCPATRRYFQW